MFNFVQKGAIARRDSWASKAEAYDYLKKRNPYDTWDHRILKSFIVRSWLHECLLPVADIPDRNMRYTKRRTGTESFM